MSMQQNLAIGVDIGGTHISSIAFDMDELKLQPRTRKQAYLDNKASMEKILKIWSETINNTISETDKNLISGIGFAMPGPFEYLKGIAKFKGNDKYEFLYDVNVGSELRKALNLNDQIPIRFMNDATAFAVGNCWVGEASRFKKVIALTLGTGLGSAFVNEGVPVVDHDHVPPEGCLWHLPYLDGIADDYFSTRWFVKSYYDAVGIRLPGVREIAALAGKGDKAALSTFFDFGKNLGLFLAPWINKFHADCVVVGGNISKAMALFVDPFREALKSVGPEVKVIRSNMMEEAAIIGASRLTDHDFWTKIIKVTPSM